MSYEAVQWAMYDAPMLLTPAGEPDVTARFVLIARAERADKKGRNTYAGPADVAQTTGLDERTVRRADRRLEEAGLLVRSGRSQHNTIRWNLDMDRKRSQDDASPLAERAERRRKAAKDRQQRFRDRLKAAADGAEGASEDAPGIESDVSIEPSVTPSEGVTNAVEERYVTPLNAVRNALSAHQTGPRTTQLNHPGTTPGGAPPPDPRRPHSPSARGTYVDGSLAEPLTQAQDQQGDSLPHTRAREPATVHEIRPGASLERPHWMPPPRGPDAELAVAEARLAIAAAARRARRGVS